MKRTIFAIFCTIFLVNQTAFAQKSCDGFGQFQKGLKTQMSHYDKNRNLTSTVNQEVKEVTTKNGEATATSVVKIKNSKGIQEIDSFITKISCSKGNIYMNFQDFMGTNAMFPKMDNAEMKISGEDVVTPTNLSVGQTLPNTEMNMEMIIGGKSLMKMTVTMKNRKVESKEKIVTPSGNWDCYKVTYTMGNSMGGDANSTGSMWMHDGMAIKTESYDKNGDIINSTLLTKYEKPSAE